MEFKEGTSVYTNNQKEVGSLQRVVIDPAKREVTHIVIQKGFIIKEDKVVPVVKVASATQDQINIDCTIEELKGMPPLQVTQYKPKEDMQDFDRSEGAQLGASIPASAMTTETVRTIPEDLVALKEGARVISSDEKHVGNIERLFTDDGKITHFTLTQGLLNKSEKSIPFDWVKMISDTEVDLGVEAQKIDSLPIVQK